MRLSGGRNDRIPGADRRPRPNAEQQTAWVPELLTDLLYLAGSTWEMGTPSP